MHDINLVCKDCKAPFTFTVGEQEFFEKLVAEGKMEVLQQPKRCAACRKIRKQQKEEQASY